MKRSIPLLIRCFVTLLYVAAVASMVVRGNPWTMDTTVYFVGAGVVLLVFVLFPWGDER